MAQPYQTELDQHLIHELRTLARRGARASELVACIRTALGAFDATVPILAYLSTSFFVPLPVVLPLREDQGEGPFGKAIQVAFWFSAALTNDVCAESWDWDRFWRMFRGNFSANDLETITLPAGSISFIHPPASPRDIYARAVFDAYIDKSGLSGASETEVYHQVGRVAAKFLKVIERAAPVGDAERLSMPMKFEYQIQDQGPKYHLVCMVQALREVARDLAETSVPSA